MLPDDIGRALVVLGLALAALGALLLVGSHVPWLGHLPGDITIGNEHVRIYIPLATSLLLSVLLTLLLNILARR